MILDAEQQLAMMSIRAMAETSVAVMDLDWKSFPYLSADEMMAVQIANTTEEAMENIDKMMALHLLAVVSVLLIEERRKHA